MSSRASENQIAERNKEKARCERLGLVYVGMQCLLTGMTHTQPKPTQLPAVSFKNKAYNAWARNPR